MVQHYLTHVFPNGFKAQIVATSREAAVRYKRWIDASLRLSLRRLRQNNPNKLALELLQKLETDVIISGGHNELPLNNSFSHRS
jgi:type I restriction enzyme R subunit